MANFISELKSEIFDVMHYMSSLIDEFFCIYGIIILEPILRNGNIYLCLFISINISVCIIKIDFLKDFSSSIEVFLGSMNFGNFLLNVSILKKLRLKFAYFFFKSDMSIGINALDGI